MLTFCPPAGVFERLQTALEPPSSFPNAEIFSHDEWIEFKGAEDEDPLWSGEDSRLMEEALPSEFI